MENMAAKRLSCGLELSSLTDINSSLNAVTSSGYDFLCGPVIHPRFRREFLSGKVSLRPGAFTRPDTLITTRDWTSLVIAKISPHIDVDAPNEILRKNSEKMLEQELNFFSHLGIRAVIIPLKSANCINLGRIIHSKVLTGGPYQSSYNIWMRIPMVDPATFSDIWLNNDHGEEATHAERTWDWWNLFRGMCNWERRIQIALELTPDLPSAEILQTWLGEPVKCLVVPTHLFLTNKKGYPVLSRPHQEIVQQFYKQDTEVMITGTNRHEHIKLYQQYMDYIFQSQSPDDPVKQFARGFEDFLQCPLQPLMDNLESQTYEVFEKDPIKYTEYQKAMYQALIDTVDDSEKETKRVVLMVVGAGRGPLVRAALSAADKSGRNVKIYAVEKNPNAIVTLCAQQDEMWGDQVTVVSCDMRTWEAPEKADILVSELLGSFGDNELSPECLDGAQKFLKPDGISIPCSYTSYLSPIQSSKLYNEFRQYRELNKHPMTPFETPYVVHLHNFVELSRPQPLFTFVHPNKDAVIDNTRYKQLHFHVNLDGILNGLAGYFNAILYKDIRISIQPESHSLGMFSWFPLLFPFKEPVPLTKGDTIEVNFWRLTNQKNVWYEWCITKPVTCPIHNPNGRSYTIGL